jgi:phosphatidate cytidylyltransferase
MSTPRILSAIVAIILALGMILLGGWFFTLSFSVIVYLGLHEFFQLARAKGIVPAAKTTVLASIVLLVLATISPSLADAAMPIAVTIICFYLLFQPELATIADVAASVLGLFYGGYLPSYWVRLRSLGSTGAVAPFNDNWLQSITDVQAFSFSLSNLQFGLAITLLTFACIWAADIGAYVFGKLLGKTRLSEISPKKTVEGALFGIVGSMLVAIAGAWQLGFAFWPLTGAALGLLIGVSSLLGDLTESMMKRDAGVKDSGQLIPGHGGILDRTDSYVFTAPLVYYFITLLLPLLDSV